ncbi:uncharacterized protein BDR25DRAFT_368253, partial [Lindgomyces ingoldianus]
SRMAILAKNAAKGPFQLVTVVNSKDQYNLLEDPSIPKPDLDAEIHAIFQKSNWKGVNDILFLNLQPSLRLASMFLRNESFLEWLVAPLVGRMLTDIQSGKTYLSDPLRNRTGTERNGLVQEVRMALHCLAHSTHFHFEAPTQSKFYGRTMIHRTQPLHTSVCTSRFIRNNLGIKIEIRLEYQRFLENSYTSSTLCQRLRHDFSLATTLVHELVHAIGIMRRGDLKEPHLRLDEPENSELGNAFENFFFGAIINPADKASDAPSFLMGKPWADDKTTDAAGGKEWVTIPMSYVAQWFRKDTWDIIKKDGPTAIPPPSVRLKVQ